MNDRWEPATAGGAPAELALGAVVTRFIFSKSQFNTKGAKTAAFDPSPHHELSVADITDLADPECWELSRASLGTAPGRDSIYARADIQVSDVRAVHLGVLRDDTPFIRHSIIVGWPSLDDPDERKAAWKGLALQLSLAASLHIPASPISAGT